MRLWSLHPKYLDVKGLVALWREGLLAQAVLSEKTKGYINHPQLQRFREQPAPVGCIAEYLIAVYEESVRRGYRFDATKINHARSRGQLTVTDGQLQFEWFHLMEKLKIRSPDRYAQLLSVATPLPHPLFLAVDGEPAEWEKNRRNRAK
jgi:hypothetical protein